MNLTDYEKRAAAMQYAEQWIEERRGYALTSFHIAIAATVNGAEFFDPQPEEFLPELDRYVTVTRPWSKQQEPAYDGVLITGETISLAPLKGRDYRSALEFLTLLLQEQKINMPDHPNLLLAGPVISIIGQTAEEALEALYRLSPNPYDTSMHLENRPIPRNQ